MARGRIAFVAIAITAGLGGCATPPKNPEALAIYRQNHDPLEPTNRFFYRVSDSLDTHVVAPAARGYVYAVPKAARTHVTDFFQNLGSPAILLNDMLQGKPHRAGTTLMRLLINTTIGVGGLFDVAKPLGYPRHETDFGITLALWGVGPGPYLFIPLLGPSGVRDAVGFGVDGAAGPTNYIGQGTTVLALKASQPVAEGVNTRAKLIGTIEPIKRTSLDPYATFRSLYQQHRAATIAETRADNRQTTPGWFAPASSSPQ